MGRNDMTTPSISSDRRLLIRPPRPLAIAAASILIVVATYAWGALPYAPPREARPVTPPNPIATAGGQTPIDTGATAIGSLRQIDHSIEAWSKNLAANPKDFLAATNLSLLYHGRGRLTYDLADHERALTAARTALTIAPTYGPARASEATILFTLHDFEGAYAVADALVRDDTSQTGALATRFDAELELGRLDDARSDLRRLGPIGGPGVLIRQARLDSATGDPAGALDAARRARTAAIDDDEQDIGFYAYAVGEYGRLAGDAATARAGFVEAIEARSDDVAALVGLARIDAFEGKVDVAIDDLRRATAIAPQPEALALLGDLETGANDPGATKTYETVRFIERLGDIQSKTFDRQLLRFELDHAGASDDVLDRAKASLDERPDWTGHDAVAWALYRLGRFDEAAAQMAAARALGADDARLRFHDGAIELSRGNGAEGRASLESALDLGPALDPIERAEATRLLGG
jgi:tetratricopeptide (TPR) repeat protein